MCEYHSWHLCTNTYVLCTLMLQYVLNLNLYEIKKNTCFAFHPIFCFYFFQVFQWNQFAKMTSRAVYNERLFPYYMKAFPLKDTGLYLRVYLHIRIPCTHQAQFTYCSLILTQESNKLDYLFCSTFYFRLRLINVSYIFTLRNKYFSFHCTNKLEEIIQ